MKILTTVTASAGLDVASTGSDTIKLGSANTENNDAAVDNLTVWANADFKNNITLGSSNSDKVISNASISASAGVSGSLFIGDGGGLINLSASNITNFTNDVRNQISAGTGISITSGQISTSNIPNASLANSSTTLGSTALILGSTTTSITGLTNINSTALTGTNISGTTNLIVGGNVGVGTASPGAEVDVVGNGFINLDLRSAGASAGSYVTLRRSGGTTASRTILTNGDYVGGYLFSGYDGATYRDVAAIYGVVDGIPGSNDMPGAIAFSTTADGAGTTTERMRIISNGNIGIGTSNPGSKLDVNGTIAGSNFKFPAVQVSSADANTLDDYEEGTWTPTLSASTTSNFTYISQTGTYTKTGRQIIANGYILLSSTGSSSGNLRIGSLPFTSIAGTTAGNGYVGTSTGLAAAITVSPNGVVLPSNTLMSIYKSAAGGSTIMNVTDATNNTLLSFTAIYFTT